MPKVRLFRFCDLFIASPCKKLSLDRTRNDRFDPSIVFGKSSSSSCSSVGAIVIGIVMLKARLEHDTVYSRCLVTSQPVQRGELVVEEWPFAYGPKRESGIVCLGCYRYLQFGEDGDSLDRCELCDWPLCANCADADDDDDDHRAECEVFAEARVTFAGNVSDDGVCPQLDCITPLRLVAGH